MKKQNGSSESHLGLRVPTVLLDEVRQIARRDERSVSYHARKALEHYVKLAKRRKAKA